MSAAAYPPLKAIAAIGQNRVIGAGNKLPWNLPEEMRWFQDTTRGHTLLMGRKTFESAGGKAFSKRKTIVVTRQNTQWPGVETLADWRLLRPEQIQGDLYVCGGVEIYAQMLPYVTDLVLTHVFLSPQGDAFFPPFEDQFVATEMLLERPQFKVVRYSNRDPLPFPAP
jgi:dihydrofolate reductase